MCLDKVILYSIENCPYCNILKTKLATMCICHELCMDEDVMKIKNIMTAPILEVNGEMMGFNEAIKWVNEQTKVEAEA